jgi:enoyl-CoA hydratase/carnithine racemase
MIGAINGPASIHAQIGLLCDLCLASETATFSDSVHFSDAMVPGDGVHVFWPMVLGPNRGRYFLITGQEIDAEEALRLGLVGEVLPPEQLLPRAWELAEWVMTRPQLVRRLTREVLTLELRRAMTAHLGYGAALEGLAATEGW